MAKIEYFNLKEKENELPSEIVEIVDFLDFKIRLNDEENKVLLHDADMDDIIKM